MSLAVQYYADAYIAAFVPQNCFMPRPKVGSAVLQLPTHRQKPVSVKDEGLMFALIKAAFGQRRKTLVNCLRNAQQLDFSKEQVLAAFETVGIS